MKNRAITLLACLLVLLCIFSTETITVSAQAANESGTALDYAPKPSYTLITDASMYKTFTPGKSLYALSNGSTNYGYSKLNTSEKNAYKLIKKAAQARAVNRLIDFSNCNLTVSQLYNAFSCFYYDNPQFFWFSSACVILSDTDSGVALGLAIGSVYKTSDGKIDNPTINNIQKKIDKAAAVYLKAIENVAGDYEKELILHDMIINNTSYDTSLKVKAYDSTIVGPFLHHTARSCGYSRAFQYLLNLSGIDCIFAVGSAGYAGHVWNVVKINGSYYQTDIAWDDPVGRFESVSHEYFNLTDNEIMSNHYVNETTAVYKLPACTADTDNYYVKAGVNCGSADDFTDRAVPFIVSEINNGSYDVEIKAADSETYEKLLKLLIDDDYATDYFSQIVENVKQKVDSEHSDLCVCGFSKNDGLNILTIHFMRGGDTIDKTDLSQKISYVKNYLSDSGDFTADSYAALKNTLSAAERVNLSGCSTQNEIDTVVKSLQSAVYGLEVSM